MSWNIAKLLTLITDPCWTSKISTGNLVDWVNWQIGCVSIQGLYPNCRHNAGRSTVSIHLKLKQKIVINPLGFQQSFQSQKWVEGSEVLLWDGIPQVGVGSSVPKTPMHCADERNWNKDILVGARMKGDGGVCDDASVENREEGCWYRPSMRSEKFGCNDKKFYCCCFTKFCPSRISEMQIKPLIDDDVIW